jgi:hypothetical protein
MLDTVKRSREHQSLPRGVVTRKEFREQLAKEFEIIADLGAKRGRPALSVLGAERKQIDLVSGVHIMRLLEDDYERKGYVIDTEMDDFRTDRGRRTFVGSILNNMSRFALKETPGAPLKTLYQSSGRFIRLRITEPGTRNGPGRYRYVTKRSASRLEVLAAFNTQQEEEHRRSKEVTTRLQTYAVALNQWPDGMTFEEAFTQEAARRQRRKP